MPITLAGLSYCWSVYKLRFLDRLDAGDTLLRIAVLPELLLSIWLSLFQVAAYCLALLKRPQRW